MGRTVLAEQTVSVYFDEILKSKKFRIGLIIGQASSQCDYVVHVACTPEPKEEDRVSDSGDSKVRGAGVGHGEKKEVETSKEEMTRLDDVDGSWIAEHSKQVTRMLPGGISVLGIFIIGTDDPFQGSTSQGKIRCVLTSIQKVLGKSPFLYGDSGSSEKIVLYICSISQKYICRSVDLSANVCSPKPADWKFQSCITRWQQLDCPFLLDLPVSLTKEKSAQSLWRQIQTALVPFHHAVNSAICLIDGKLRPNTEPLYPVGEKKKKQPRNVEGAGEQKHHSVDLLLAEDRDSSDGLVMSACGARMRLCGRLHGRAYLHQKATVTQAAEAVKQDLVRSLASRCEMHCDSLVGEDNGTCEATPIIHEPPRRLFVPLPGHQVAVSDYLFPGEGPQDSLDSFTELLDLHVTEDEVQEDWETPADPADIESSEPESEISSLEDFPLSSGGYKCSVTTVTLTVVIALLGIAISYLSLQGPK